MDDKLVTLNVSEEIIKEIVNKKIQAEIIEKTGSVKSFVEKMVELALRQKVNHRGNVSSSSYDNRYDFVEIVTANAIQEMAKKAFEEWLQVNKEKILIAVKKELNDSKRQKAIAKCYLDAIEKSLTCHWNMSCNINFKKDE